MGAATNPVADHRVWPQNGPVRWLLVGLLLYVFGGLAMLFASLSVAGAALGAIGIDASAGTMGLSVRNAAFPLGWGAFVAAVSVPLGRRLVPGVRFDAVGWVILGMGLVIASVATFLGIEFVRERLGYFSSRAMGFTTFTAPALVAIALAGWATLALPRDQARVLAGATLAAVGALALSLLPSIEGALDGIDATSIPLVIALALGVGYAVIVSLVVVRLLVPRRRA